MNTGIGLIIILIAGVIINIGVVLWGHYHIRKLNERCHWKDDDDGVFESHWEADCGFEWIFTEGGPKENGMIYCPSCGKRIKALDNKPLEHTSCDGCQYVGKVDETACSRCGSNFSLWTGGGKK